MSELTACLRIPRTTLIRIISTLEQQHFIQRDRDGRFELGAMLLAVAGNASQPSALRLQAVPVLNELSETCQETSHLAIPARDRVLLLEVCDSPQPLRVASRPGALVDAHCSGTGKVLMAFRSDFRLSVRNHSNLQSRTSNTHTSWDSLEDEFEEIRHQGYAIDNEEYFDGVRCLAAPVYHPISGVVCAAIGITAGTLHFPKHKMSIIAKAVQNAASQLGQRLSGAPVN